MDPVERLFVDIWEGIKAVGRFFVSVFEIIGKFFGFVMKNFPLMIFAVLTGFVLYFLYKIFQAENS